jgi:hypothetical protein
LESDAQGIMADRLFLSVWFPSFRENDIAPRTLSVLRQFPFSQTRPGITYVGVHAVGWNEPLVLDHTFKQGTDPERAVQLAAELVHPDSAWEFQAHWDLWIPEEEGELDVQWRVQPQPVQFLVHGETFEEGIYKEQGHIEVDFGLDTPFLAEELEMDPDAERRVKANIKRLVDFTSAVEKNCGITGRVLWSDSEEENLAQKLIARLQKVH